VQLPGLLEVATFSRVDRFYEEFRQFFWGSFSFYRNANGCAEGESSVVPSMPIGWMTAEGFVRVKHKMYLSHFTLE
jgi:hypothetical protein